MPSIPHDELNWASSVWGVWQIVLWGYPVWRFADYTKAIELDPKSARAYSNRGNTRSALGDKQ